MLREHWGSRVDQTHDQTSQSALPLLVRSSGDTQWRHLPLIPKQTQLVSSQPYLTASCCHAPGINDTDILLAVTTSTNCTSKMFAWSASCDWDPITNRPTLGTMVVCPGFFKQTEGEQLATMVHESIHTLVRTQQTAQSYTTNGSWLGSQRLAPAYTGYVVVRMQLHVKLVECWWLDIILQSPTHVLQLLR